jgi:SET domain-containing protein
MAKTDKRQYNIEIRRIKKGNHSMWGLFAMEDIEEGSFLCEYKGEILTKKQGDMRGSFYDSQGLSYLFDMNEPAEKEKRE